MARITIFVTLPDVDVRDGWDDDTVELEASIKATLHELVGDDGNVYVPHVLGIDVEDVLADDD